MWEQPFLRVYTFSGMGLDFILAYKASSTTIQQVLLLIMYRAVFGERQRKSLREQSCDQHHFE